MKKNNIIIIICCIGLVIIGLSVGVSLTSGKPDWPYNRDTGEKKHSVDTLLYYKGFLTGYRDALAGDTTELTRIDHETNFK